MADALFTTPIPVNEPVLGYAPGSPEKKALKAELKRQASEQIEIPLIIGGEEVKTGDTIDLVMPHDHKHVLAKVHMAGEKEAQMAVDAAMKAKKDWENVPAEERAAVFLKAADLLAGPWRQVSNASTMLGQSKTCHQAEIDSACELIDFFRFNPKYMEELYRQQPLSVRGIWNQVEYRPLDGFIYAITPFNFTSIAGNLPHAPALMGNTTIWKPSRTSILSNYYIMRLFEAAGLPVGVINFLPGHASKVTKVLLNSPDFNGIHYTGSTEVFQMLWQQAADNLKNYKAYPRIVGETGGKDFILAHASANPDVLVTGLIRGAFEYQGQKCSAASRAYIPRSLWNAIKDDLLSQVKNMKMGDPRDFTNFMAAVIDEASFNNCKDYIDHAKAASDAEILVGGGTDKKIGYFVEPTVVQTTNPAYRSMEEEIFGPILTIYVYEDGDYEKTIELCDKTSPYALTGAVFATDRKAVWQAHKGLRYAAGNFYVNDKPTGAVVGQQPFGGARASGTNDKAGSFLNLIRWVSMRTLKENFDPPRDYRYGFLAEE
jgi:1-pyrroline-5-carboxylate dehydrogenase